MGRGVTCSHILYNFANEFTCDKPHYPYELPEGWCWTTLGEISNYGTTVNIQVEDIEENEWILELEDVEKETANIIQRLSKGERSVKGTRHKFNAGDILYSKLRTYLNKVLVAPNKGYCTTEIMPLNTYGIMSNEYICHVLRSPFFLGYTLQCGYGVKMPRLSTTDACNGMIPLPPLKEQLRIAKEIKRWFALIDIIESGKENLQTAIKQTKSKILDLAIHGKLVPQDPTDEPASELLKRINPKVEIACDNAQYGKLPNGWCECNLSSLCKIKGGKRIPRGQTFSKAKTPHIYIRVSDMKNNTIVATDLKYIDDDVYQTIKNYTISSSDLYLTIAGTIGNVGYVPKQFDGMNLTENAAKLTNIICDKKFLMYSLLSSKAQEHFKSRFHQVAQPKLSIETANSTIVCLPPLNEQHRIVAKIEELFALLDNIASAL